MHRRALLTATALLCAGTLAAPALTATELQFGTTSPPGNMQYESAAEFARRVTERLGGAYEVVVYPSSQLGDDQEMLQKLKLGTQDMSQPSTITSTIVP